MSDQTHQQVMELLGAYAMDAVSEDEARAVEEHLAGCPTCRAEVDEHRQTTGLLANSGGDAPSHLWDRIAARLDVPEGGDEARDLRALFAGTPSPTTQPEPHATHRASLATPGVARRGASWLAAAAAVVVLLVAITALGIEVTHLNHRVGQLQSASQQPALLRAAHEALGNPDARRVALKAKANGEAMGEIVVLPSGSAFLVQSKLPTLPSDRTYQLWGERNHHLISLSLLGSDPSTVAFRVDPSSPPSSLAVTDEQAGGAPQPTSTPVASATG
jgi:anti-sigma factor RsiW